MTEKTVTKSEGCFVPLLLEHQRSLYNFIVSLIHDHAEAEDLLQKTGMVLWKKFDQYKPGTDFLAWARQIAKYEVLTFIKTKSRSRISFNSATIDLLADDAGEDASNANAHFDALRRCLEQLRPVDHDLVKRCYLGGLSIRNIAVSLNRSADGVYQSLHRIRTTLVECIQRRLSAEERI